MSALLEVDGLGVDYRAGGRRLRALDSVGFELRAGETLGVVGESGSGKSTLARAILSLVPANRGVVRWQGDDLARLDASALRQLRRHLTVVFQDPLASLDPRFTAADSVAEPLSVHEPGLEVAARRRAVDAMLERVGLARALGDRFPHELSGGQCQRVAIARAMITRPKLVVCDEPWSALDVSVQAQIVNLFQEFQREDGTALLVISHNLAVVRRLCARVLVLYLGRVMELAPRELLYGAPLHPYTRLLLDSVPVLGRSRPIAAAPAGEPGSPLAPPSGCVFRLRCRHAIERCAREVPPLTEPTAGRSVACLRAAEGVANAGS
jgi:oligopeptide transport system ATP-binding protein